jgi:NADPH-dependent F420 reductase
VILSLSYVGLHDFVRQAAPVLEGKLVIDTITPLVRRPHFWELAPVPGAASVGELLSGMLPGARVVSTLKNLSASRLQHVAEELDADVLICGADPAARSEAAALISCIPRLRPVDAGGIQNARYLEAMTALLVDLNRRHHAHSSIRITGLR